MGEGQGIMGAQRQRRLSPQGVMGEGVQRWKGEGKAPVPGSSSRCKALWAGARACRFAELQAAGWGLGCVQRAAGRGRDDGGIPVRELGYPPPPP